MENKSLLDALRNQISAQPKVEARDTTQASNRLLTARNSGRAGQTSGPQITSSAEAVANQNTQQQLNQQTQNNQIAAQDIGIQADRQQQIQAQDQADILQRSSEISRALSQQEEHLFTQLERDKDQLQTQESQLNLEILGASLALKDQQYLYAIENQGRISRLDDSNQFQIELRKAVFADELDLFKDQIAFNDLLQADQREFQVELSKISLEDALLIATQTSQAQAVTNITTQAGNVASQISAINTKKDTPNDQ